MHDTIKSVLRFYLISVIWLAVTMGMGFAILGPVDSTLEPLGASATIRGLSAIAIGIAAGSLVAWLLWISIPVRSRSTARQMVGDSRDASMATVASSGSRASS